MADQVFEVNDKMKEIVKRLCDERADLFPQVDPVMIECALRTDKAAPESCADVLKIKGIRGPLNCLTDKRYLIFGYQSLWDVIPDDKRIAYIAFALKHVRVPTTEELNKLAEKGLHWEWGKLDKPDFTSFKSFARVFGVDWEDSEEIPNILSDTDVVI